MLDDQKPQVDKSVVAKWVKDFQARGFCVLDDATAREPSLFNRLRGRKVSVQYARRDFRDYCRAGKLVSGIPEDAYILGCLPLIVGTSFEPRGGDIVTDSVTGMSFGNLCQTYRPTHDSAGVSPLFHEFFTRMFPDDCERQIVLQYLAHIFQRPRERPSWHLMIPSAMGTGKGVLVEKILNPLLLHTSIATSFGKLTAQHSTVLADNLVVLLDDCKATTASQQTQLKSLLSEERVYIDRKFQDARMVPTYARIILASNEQKPLELEEGERRWFVVQRVEHVQGKRSAIDTLAPVTAPC